MSELEADRLEGAPHPRETANLIGHGAQEQMVLEALASGRLHHAWLLGGPQGVGKATFAYRLARRMLAGVQPGQRLATLDVAPDHPVARKVMAQSHPDLFVLRRIIRKDGKALTANIPVDLVRRALEIFGTTAAEGGWRICIVDSAEDMDRGAANALLKVLEEPPPGCLFLIIAHQPQRVMATIRSRCRKLEFAPLAVAEVEAAMRQAGAEGQADDATIRQAAAVSLGSVLTGLQRLDAESLALIAAVRHMLALLPKLALRELAALAEDVGTRGRDDDLALMLETVGEWLSERIRMEAASGAGSLRPLVEIWEQTTQAARDADAYNLDKRPMIFALFQDFADAMGRRAA
jgi:DNA polymerase III subunit delta'